MFARENSVWEQGNSIASVENTVVSSGNDEPNPLE
jgi:hypothetical protein